MPNNFGTTSSMSDILTQESEDFTVNGKCSGCGACCPDCLNMSDNEIKRIREYIKKHDIKPCRHVPLLKKPGTSVDLLCPFVDINRPDKKCTIYEVRPEICREYICSETTEQMVKRVLEQKDNKKIMDAVGKEGERSLPVNLGQTFYPEIYTPKIGDEVIFNKRYRMMAMMYGTTLFKVMTKPDKENKVDICVVGNEKTKFHHDIAGLTKII